jgi:PiT family inorganic phosphate transporter
MIWFFLLSGLLLGWSLGANDTANIFGTAVGTRMVRFRTAATIASIFVILGAVLGGSGTTETLAALGAVNAMAGSFTVALCAGVTVAWMNRAKLPVSTTQAIVGAILGWNLFTNSPTDYTILSQIVATWILSPLMAGFFAVLLFFIFKRLLERAAWHMLMVDAYTRAGLIVVGALGAYSLGANNIANVMGVFVPASPFRDLALFDGLAFRGTQQLFLLGAIAIAVGIWTRSRRLMLTVGNDIFKLTPILALVVVLAQALVLLAFSSRGLQDLLHSLHLPALPLVPVSSTQAIIGAIFGIGLIKGVKGINFKILGRIAAGWVLTPLFAAMLTFVALFFVQNVFEQEVVHKHPSVEIRPAGPDVQSGLSGATILQPEGRPHIVQDSPDPAAPSPALLPDTTARDENNRIIPLNNDSTITSSPIH